MGSSNGRPAVIQAAPGRSVWGRLDPGPLFEFERNRLLRRPRLFVLRVLFPLVLLAALALACGQRSPNYSFFELLLSPEPLVTARQMSESGQQFVVTLFIVQALVLLVLTPPLVAGAIAEEREKKTLELLFTTHLTDADIVQGKLAGRLWQILT